MRSGWGCCGGSAPDRDGGAPAQRAEDVRLDLAYRGVVVFYAVISDEIHQVIEFFGTPAEAEAMLETVLEDEPSWRDLLYVEPVDLVTGGEKLENSYAPSSLACSGGSPNPSRRRHSRERIAEPLVGRSDEA